MDRRRFLNRLPLLTSIPLAYGTRLTTEIRSHSKILSELRELDPDDEEFWLKVREAYDVPVGRIDFNNAGIGTPTLQVLNAFVDESKNLSQLPSKRSNRLRKNRITCKEVLADMCGCQVGEVALCRNATEALTTTIFGIPLAKGDEVVLGKYDYPHVYFSWKQRELRDGIVLRYVDIGSSPKSPKKIAKSYLRAISKNTKAIQLTHLINYNGCVVPVKDIISQLPTHVKYRIVDAAQSFANTTDNISDFGATHVGVSLHKWLGAPLGTGLLYVQKDYIKETWPLFAAVPAHDSRIEKFEHHGTFNLAVLPGILAAVEFHLLVGAEIKKRRLQALADYFVDQVDSNPNIKIQSPRHNRLKSNLVLFQHTQKSIAEVHSFLWKKHKLHVTTSDWFEVRGVRMSPNVFTSKTDIDVLVNTLAEMD